MRELRINLALLVAFSAVLPVSAVWGFCLVAKLPLTGAYLVLSAVASAAIIAMILLLHVVTVSISRKPG